MDYNIGKTAYYADFVTFPLLMLFVAMVGLDWRSLYLMPLGFVLWTFAEYWLHRKLFHEAMRRDHWVHHLRPEGYVAVHPGYTAAGGVFLAGSLWSMFGVPVGGALFNGFALGYMAYVWTHDAIHHGPLGGVTSHFWTVWLRNRSILHDVHHKGAEVNFGVITSFWDGIHGTYWHPAWGDKISPQRVLTL